MLPAVRVQICMRVWHQSHTGDLEFDHEFYRHWDEADDEREQFYDHWDAAEDGDRRTYLPKK